MQSLFSAFVSAALLMVSATEAFAQVAQTAEGALRGVRSDGVKSFLGVPYAAAPIGGLRWRAPQPVTPWRGTREARAFAPACPQTGASMAGEPAPRTAEDCLFLNVWTLDTDPREPAPVMVWIHGGGYTNGATALPLYWGDRLARRGVVVVSINYRLGPLGFLAHPGLTAEAGSSGNYGIMDQIAALRWVKRNIAAFGGNPDNVTVFGQSAGATSISFLMASPQANGLFHRVIAQSGGAFEPLQLGPQYELANAENDGLAYARGLGADDVEALRALPVERLLDRDGVRISHPVIEPQILPLSPYDAYVARRQTDVPILVGANAEEARSLTDVSRVRADNYAAELTRAWGQLPAPLVNAYPFSNDAEAREARIAFEGDLRFGWDIWSWARLQARHSTNPVYYYRFSRRPPFPHGARFGWGASHFAELWYMFDHLDQESWAWQPADRRLADAMAQYWVNFARSGDPNGEDLPRWPAFTDAEPVLLDLDDAITVRPAPTNLQLRVFDQVYASVRGAAFGE